MNITFEFKTEFWTPTYTQISANTINDFKNAIKLIPLDSLLYHFYINIFNYNLISSIYTNDIAYWFYKNGYYSIAEEIASIDPTEYLDLENLKQDLINILSKYSDDKIIQKNIPLSQEFIIKTLNRFSIDPEKTMLLQVSRFDRLKDPMGVYNAYKLIKNKYDCQLVLLGSFASDDPEGEEVYKEIINQTGDDKNVFILNLPPDNHLEVNAFQRVATIVFQKSIKEGVGLVVAEALFKQQPVVGGNSGGIKKQIMDGINGYLVDT
jgi:glycosyltransferase involved in cell wall biosynthesis